MLIKETIHPCNTMATWQQIVHERPWLSSFFFLLVLSDDLVETGQIIKVLITTATDNIFIYYYRVLLLFRENKTTFHVNQLPSR